MSAAQGALARIEADLAALVAVPGASGHEARVACAIAERLPIPSRRDRLGNLIASRPGDGPRVMLFAHMDQLGLIVRAVDADGALRVHRLGGVPERVLPGLAMTVCGRHGDLPAVVAVTSHHATPPEARYVAPKAAELRLDAGFASAAEAREAGVEVGAPVVYAPALHRLAGGRVAGPAMDDRAGCAVLLEVARGLPEGSPLDLVFTVQEEFNLRGAQVAAQALRPDVAIQLDLMLATDTPDLAGLGEMRLGGGPGMSLYSFHGRGTLNGLIPHPALVRLAEAAAGAEGFALQRSAQVGVLTDASYVQLVGEGVACLDLGFPLRHSHSPVEMVDLSDVVALAELLVAMLARMGPGFELGRGG